MEANINWNIRRNLALLIAGTITLFTSLAQQAQAQIRIMPLGDSLTASIDGRPSYRYWLWKKIEARNFDVDFVGSQWGVGDGASADPGDFDQDHEGHPGATTDDILYGIDNWAAAYQPDVVLLLIGGNDFERGWSPGHAITNTRRIIAALRSANSGVVILWAMIPPGSNYNKQARSYNSALVQTARKLSTRQSPVRIVDLWSGFSGSRDTLDGEHPNTSGEKKYANRFWASLAPVLNRLSGR